MKGRHVSGALLFGVVALWPARAWAAGAGPPVAFAFDECAELDGAEVERIARIELHAGAESNGAVTAIQVACDGADDVRLTVNDPLTGKRVERTVSLAAVEPRGRARLLALAIAELARSSWMELELTPAPILPARERGVASPEQRERARAIAVAGRAQAWSGEAVVDAVVVPTVGRPLLALSLGVQRDVGPLFLGASIDGFDGVASRSTGAVTVRQLALVPAVGARISRLDLAIGARIGWASLSGSPTGPSYRGDVLSGLVAGGEASASVAIVGPMRLRARAGWLVKGERGLVSGDEDVAMEGFYATMGIGLRIGR